MVEVLPQVDLIPAVLLEPGIFSPNNRAYPAGAPAAPGAWGRYWRDCLAEAGVREVAPVREGSWHVAVRGLREPGPLETIVRVLTKVYDGLESLPAGEPPPALGGGLAVLSAGRVLLEPSCCGDLADLRNWEQAARHADPGWDVVWIGHPSTAVRRVGDRLELAFANEETPFVPAWSVDPAALQAAVAAARAELEAFALRLVPVVERVAPGVPAVFARHLAGLG